MIKTYEIDFRQKKGTKAQGIAKNKAKPRFNQPN